VTLMRAVVGRRENFLHSSELPDRRSQIGQRRGRSLPGAIQSDALTLRIFRDMAGFDHGGLLEISLRVR
jgi:hypothetical protein